MFYDFLIKFFIEGDALRHFSFLSFRSVLSFCTAFSITFIATSFFIQHHKKYGTFAQPIRKVGPQTHLVKKIGTPTMGGLLMISSLIISILLWNDLTNPFIIITFFIFITFGLIGLLDDIKKVKRGSSGGLSAKLRLFLQFSLALIAIIWLNGQSEIHSATTISLPFFQNVLIDLGVFYIPFALFIIVGTANSVNLTDGLDGLLIVPVMIAACALAVISAASGSLVLSSHISVQHIDGIAELVVLASAVVGSGMAFLWYNIHPAKIFMGDVGSLSLGGMLGMMAVLIKQELVFGIIGFLFVVEALSVILQVFWYQKFKRRLFLMAPIHHHFEKKGWGEEKIVIRFWIFALICAVIGIAGIM
jgi:phospho-N-acetylmuramoyl-pentapeptide-transferase